MYFASEKIAGFSIVMLDCWSIWNSLKPCLAQFALQERLCGGQRKAFVRNNSVFGGLVRLSLKTSFFFRGPAAVSWKDPNKNIATSFAESVDFWQENKREDLCSGETKFVNFISPSLGMSNLKVSPCQTRKMHSKIKYIFFRWALKHCFFLAAKKNPRRYFFFATTHIETK